MGLILVIDDHEDTRHVLRKLMEQWGHQTLGAETAEAALVVLAGEKPDLIIVDGMMPGVNGVEFIRLARASEATALTPIILYTAVADPTFTDNALQKGASEIWIKGQVHISDMRKRVEEYLT